MIAALGIEKLSTCGAFQAALTSNALCYHSESKHILTRCRLLAQRVKSSQVLLPIVMKIRTANAKGRSKALRTKGACNADMTAFRKSTGCCYQLGRRRFIAVVFSQLCESIFTRLCFRHTKFEFVAVVVIVIVLLLLSFKSDEIRSTASVQHLCHDVS